MEEFDKYSPYAQPVDLDEEDPYEETGFSKPRAKSDAVYGNRLDFLQADPINLFESKAGMADILKDDK